MLIKHMWDYLATIFLSGLTSWVGLIGGALIIGAIAILLAGKLKSHRLRIPAFTLLLLAGLALITVGFYSAIYVFDEHPEELAFDTLPAGEPTCGTALSPWIKAGYGIGNPCPSGCFRGLTLRKEMRMTGFPPWPKYRRELQCWAR